MNKITADKGKCRIHDGFIFGNEIYLGIDYSTGVPREDKEEYYEEIRRTRLKKNLKFNPK